MTSDLVVAFLLGVLTGLVSVWAALTWYLTR